MPITPDTSRNFLHGLSSFWTTLFSNTASLQALYDGTQIAIGQQYLDMLNAVLGTSLKHMPLFSKQYFQLYAFTPGDLNFVEGASPDLDRYVFTPTNAVAEVPSLMNQVIAPTAIIENLRDYDVLGDGTIRFDVNPFDADGMGNPYPLFPIRTVQIVYPTLFTDPGARQLKPLGIKNGDTFRFRTFTGAPITTRIAAVDGTIFLLSGTDPAYQKPLFGSSFRVTALRTPFNTQVVGALVTPSPASVTDVSSQVVQLTGGTDTVTFTSSVGAVNQYLYLFDPNNPGNSGLYRISATGPSTATLARSFNFVATATSGLVAHLIDFGGNIGNTPQAFLGNTFVDPASVTIAARRKFTVTAPDPVTGAIETWPAGGNVVEGVDYIVNEETGVLTFLTGWDPLQVPRVNYTWSLVISDFTYTFRGAFSSLSTYVVGDMVTHGGNNYVCTVANGPGSFSTANFALWVEPFTFDLARAQPQIAMWGADVLVDEQQLYLNFGYLLGFKKPTSEQYRAFLRGVAQLFVIGPTLGHFESAMNVMAGFPVVRDEGELLLGYDSGIMSSGANGQLIDSGEGNNGSLAMAASTFSSPTANFFPSDVGAVIHTRINGVDTEYVAIQYLSPTSFKVMPAPLADAANVQWTYRHNFLTDRFRLIGGSFSFSQDDVDGVITISGSPNARNNGTFRIQSVENTTTVILETPYGFTDESSLSWTFSRSKVQTVTTSRTQYQVPLNVPMDPEITTSSNFGVLLLHAFQALTTAFLVIDYLVDPSWWHNVTIPEEVLTLGTLDVSGRRRVTPQFVEHITDSLDQAAVGDFGMLVGEDSDGRSGHSRRGPANWFGSNSVVLNYPAGTPIARSRDVNQYLHVYTPGFAGDFQILQVGPDNETLVLSNFPPPEANGLVPPQVLDVELPPLMYRRTVAFVMFDKFLKYHAIQIKIDPSVPLTQEFIAEITGVIKQAKPSWTFIYVEPVTSFLDTLMMSDTLDLVFGPYLTDKIFDVDNAAYVGPPGLLNVNDAFLFQTDVQTIGNTPGTYTIAPTAPYAMPFRTYFLFGRFDLSVTVSGSGGRHPAEGTDYTFDYVSGTLTLTSTLSAAPQFHTVEVYLRQRLPSDTLASYETPVVTGGTDPTARVNPHQTLADVGLIDRSVQINLS
jgi:hypothetical protein